MATRRKTPPVQVNTKPGHRIEYPPLDEILPATRNPKQHDEEAIGNSIARFGLAELPLVDERTGRLVAGHGRLDQLRAARDAGEAPPSGVQVGDDGTWFVPVVRGWSSRSDTDAEAYLLASNNLTTRGGWDMLGLAETLQHLSQVDPTLVDVAGWSAGELDDMLKMLEPPDLDDLGRDLGDPDPSDNWPIVRVKVPKHVAAAWRSHVETFNGEEPAAFASLLGVNPVDPGESDWTP